MHSLHVYARRILVQISHTTFAPAPSRRVQNFGLHSHRTPRSPCLQDRSKPQCQVLAPGTFREDNTRSRFQSVVTRTRGHASHSHGHENDNIYLVSSDKNDAGVRITRIGLFVNLGMAVGKGAGGYLFHSQALIADAFHALTDLVSDLMTLATVSWSLKPPTTRFPYGYGKVESLGALSVSGLLLIGGLGMGVNAAEILYAQFILDGLQDHSHQHGILSFLGHRHSHGTILPNLNAAWLAGGSIVVKEWLYQKTMNIATERKSAVLASNAVHHRIDSLTSIVALMTIGGAHLFTNASWLDPVGGLLISAMVIKAGLSNISSALLELADVCVDSELTAAVRKAAEQALTDGFVQQNIDFEGGRLATVGSVQGVKSGQNYLMDVQLNIPERWSIDKVQAVEDMVRHQVGSTVRGLRKVRIRCVPQEKTNSSFRDEFIDPIISPHDRLRTGVGFQDGRRINDPDSAAVESTEKDDAKGD